MVGKSNMPIGTSINETIEVSRSDLQRLLWLVMRNDRTSASTSGLFNRAARRREMKSKLCNLLGITEEIADDQFKFEE